VIAEPLNDAECLSKLTAIAKEGTSAPDVKALAARFANTRELVRWIRGLPQRDDTGNADDGPRVVCDVGQRARLVSEDPNCVERAILYLAVAEVLDPEPVRQLATVDVSATMRHTFPVENGDPVVLDPEIRRNALRAQLWTLRNGAGGTDGEELQAVDAAALLGWLLDLAEDAADEDAGERGVRRVARARQVVAALLAGEHIHARDRGHVLYALRLAGEVAPWFGETGRDGYRLARALVARVVTRRTVSARALRNVTAERVVYWGGKAIASFYGVGGLYDSAYAEVKGRPSARANEPKATAPPTTLPSGQANRTRAPEVAHPQRSEAPPAMGAGDAR